MLHISTEQLERFRRIKEAISEKSNLPDKDAWRECSDDDIWIRVVSQVVVVGRAAPADKLWQPTVRSQISWERLSRIDDDAAAQAVWEVLREIGARYAGREWRSCRKTKALMRNLTYLKQYPQGPKGFLRDVATLSGPSQAKVRFVSSQLSYIKHKGARDFLISGFGLIKDHIALDSRIRNVLARLGVVLPERVTSDPAVYEQVERELIKQVCVPLGITGAELDQLLFNHYKEILRMF